MKSNIFRPIFVIPATIIVAAVMYNHLLKPAPVKTDTATVQTTQQTAQPAIQNNIIYVPSLKTFSQAIEPLKSVNHLTLKIGQTSNLPVKVTNTSQESWQTDESANNKLKDGHFVRFSYHWKDANGTTLPIEGARTTFATNITPGQTVNLNALIGQPPSKPGKYTLSLSLLQEHVRWFVDNGAKAYDIPVTVVN